MLNANTKLFLICYRFETIQYQMADKPTTPIKLFKTNANAHLWKRNIAKNLRQMGLNYIDSSGRERPARKVREPCSTTCRHECSLNFSTDIRKMLHTNYWQMTNDRKQLFIGKYVERIAKKRCTTLNEDSRRQFSLFYYLPLNDKRLKVCRTFFVNTLNISPFVVSFHFRKEAEKINNIL